MRATALLLEDDAFFAKVVKKYLQQAAREVPREEATFLVQWMQRYHYIHFFLNRHTEKSHWEIPTSAASTPQSHKSHHHKNHTFSIALGEVAKLFQDTYAATTSDHVITNPSKSSSNDLTAPLAAPLLEVFLTRLQNMITRAVNKIRGLFNAALHRLSIPVHHPPNLHLRTVFRLLKLHPDDGKNEDNDYALLTLKAHIIIHSTMPLSWINVNTSCC